ncbi:MAG TPA: HAD family phosphatase [Gammaproteobacteria bacterium]|nr:HAD family phosphatase [Gammaproteobacteria bacterium]
MNIKNIIFDLGGVILNIDFKRTYVAFQKLGMMRFEVLYSQNKQSGLFDDFETGKISADVFRNELRTQLQVDISDENFDEAWNAMLLDLPKDRLDFISHLRKSYRVFLFSNTNEIHLQAFFRICQRQHRINSLMDYFEKEYYSCRFGKRKPNPEAFQIIINENNMNASETLFIDDTLQHVLGARQVGLCAVHLAQGKTIFDLRLMRVL